MNPLFLLVAAVAGLIVWKRAKGTTTPSKSKATGIPGSGTPGVTRPQDQISGWMQQANDVAVKTGTDWASKALATGLQAAQLALTPSTKANAPALGDTAETKNVSSDQYSTADFGDDGSGDNAGGDSSDAGDGSDQSDNSGD